MIRTATTIISLAFATAVFVWSQIHWTLIEKKNTELLDNLSSITSTCSGFPREFRDIINENEQMKVQVESIIRNRLGRKENLAKLQKLIKGRNKQYGIGGGER